MTLRKFFIGRAIGFIVVMVLVGGFFLLNSYIRHEELKETSTFEPYKATLTGEFICLPFRDTSINPYDNCTHGIKTDAGEYYAVDFALVSKDVMTLLLKTRFTANGIITPIERLNTDHWQKYPIVGIFSVTDSVKY